MWCCIKDAPRVGRGLCCLFAGAMASRSMSPAAVLHPALRRTIPALVCFSASDACTSGASRADEATNDSQYPEAWIWEREDVPVREITSWARKHDRIKPLMAAALAEVAAGCDDLIRSAAAPLAPCSRAGAGWSLRE